MDITEKISVNDLSGANPKVPFSTVIAGAESMYNSYNSLLLEQFQTELPKFENSVIYNNINIIKNYVCNAISPKSWDIDDLGEDEFIVIQGIYTLLKLSIDQHNYRQTNLSLEQRYFSVFVLAALSRFRLDAEWLGEYLPLDIDDVDGVYFTKSELSFLLGTTEKDFDNKVIKAKRILKDTSEKNLKYLKDHEGNTIFDIKKMPQNYQKQ